MILGFLGFAYVAVKLGDIEVIGQKETYSLEARFESVSGLKPGADIEISGVKIGKVDSIKLDYEAYEAIVLLMIDREVRIQDDSTASVRTAGIIGDRFINITPGGSDVYLEAGELISDTESAISLEELVSKYIFENE